MNNIFFLNANYYKGINTLIKEKPLTTNQLIQEKSRRILSKLFSAKSIVIDADKNSSFYKKVEEAMREISLVKPGRKLLKRLQGSGVSIKEASNKPQTDGNLFCPPKENRFSVLKNTVYINPSTVSFNISGEKRELFQSDMKVNLAHELIHAMHYFEDPEKSIARARVEHPVFTNLEELYTITGLSNTSYSETIALCENAFLKAWGKKPRVTHNYGLEFDSQENVTDMDFTLGHMVIAQAPGSVLELLQKDRNNINRRYNLSWLASEQSKNSHLNLPNKKLYPLTIAVEMDNEEILEILLQNGAKIDVHDDFRGPVFHAFKKNKALAKKLFTHAYHEKKISMDVKLSYASLMGFTEIVDTLIEQGVQIDVNDHLGGPLVAACKGAHMDLARKLIEEIKKRGNIEVAERQLTKLVNKLPSTFYELMIHLDDFLKENAPKEKYVPLFHRALMQKHIDSEPLCQWIIEKHKQRGITGVDPEGNNILMALVKHIDCIPKKTGFSLTIYPASKLLFSLFQDKDIDLTLRNNQGETILSLAIETNDYDFANGVMEEYERRNIAISVMERNKVESLKTKKESEVNERKCRKCNIDAYYAFCMKEKQTPKSKD